MEATSIEEVLKIIKEKFNEKSVSNFGLWFRGQPDYSFELIPSIFRQGNKYGGKLFNEAAMFREFLLLRENQINSNFSTFEWLLMMQHFRLPTRLLDWSSNLLVGLFFLLKNESTDGALFVLDPVKLNNHSEPEAGGNMYDRLSNGVVMRSNLSRIKNLTQYIFLNEIIQTMNMQNKKLNIKSNELDDAIWQRSIERPIAVIPSQNNDRIFLQHSRFTLHGGIQYGDEIFLNKYEIGEIAPDSFIKIKIPQNAKSALKKDLTLCGVHQASLFPELDYQSEFIRDKWTKT